MKNRFFLLLIVFGCLIGCHKADYVFPAADGLYQRWKIENTDLYITFLREGIVLYGADGKSVSCCSVPRYFRREDSVLIFKDVAPKTLPFELSKPTGCELVYCIGVTSASYSDWRIVSLTPDRMVLNMGYGSNQTYIAAP